MVNIKGQVNPKTSHEGPEGKWNYSCTLSLTSALDGVGWLTPRPGRLPPGKRPGTYFIGNLVCPMAGQDECGKSLPHRDSTPGSSSP